MIYLILLVGLILRLISLNQSFWLDEATSAIVARDLSFSQIITKFFPGDFHPPIYYLLLKFWSLVFGNSEVSLRMPSVIFGLATVYVVYLIGKKIRSTKYESRNKFPEIAALLLATSGLHIYYSQEARMYAMSAFFVAFSFYFFVKILQRARPPSQTQALRAGRLGEWALFSISLALIFLTDYLSALILIVFWITAIFKTKDQSWWNKFVTSHIILVFSVGLWLPFFLEQFKAGLSVKSTSPSWWNILGRTTLKEILLVPTKFIFGRISFDNKFLYFSIVAACSLIFLYLLLRSLKNFKANKFFWAWLTLPVFILFLVGLIVPVFNYFRIIFVLPAFYLLIASGIRELDKKYASYLIAFVILINLFSSLYYLGNSRFHRENWRGLVNFIESQSNSNSITLFVADSQMEAYKYYAKNSKFAGPESLSRGYDTIWLMRYVQPVFDPEDKLRFKIQDLGFKKIAEHDFNGVVVWKYANK